MFKVQLAKGAVSAAVLAAQSGCSVPPSAPAPTTAPRAEAAPARAPITFRQLLERPRAQATARIAYGPDPLQFGELWAPEGRGPHPVVVLIHGGCWRADLPGLELMDYMAEDLRRSGVAVWNLEYRRLGPAGSGYPQVFQDVARGVDHLRTFAGVQRLDLRRLVFAGHSAGGHLALWAASRPKLPRTSPLFTPQPLTTRKVVTLAGINDLESYRANGPEACGGPELIDRLVGSPRPAPFADTSPAALLPIGTPLTVVSGALDRIVPSRFGREYAAAAVRAGDPACVLDVAGAGHFELIDPAAAAWPQVKAEITSVLRAGCMGR
ncbi:MAG: alpha/beta hydrolase [Proteobacteria bacterium]|nr:alpha/beta hydrolase [Pseudomonadota bacterium]